MGLAVEKSKRQPAGGYGHARAMTRLRKESVEIVAVRHCALRAQPAERQETVE
jgi:hypothetical protein